MSSVRETLRAELGAAVLSARGEGLDSVLVLDAGAVPGALARAQALGCNVLVDITCVDHLRWVPAGRGTPSHPDRMPRWELPKPPSRFKLVYRLMALDAGQGAVRERLALECWLEGDAGPASARSLWPNADWLEREVWDMFGVRFSDRPDIKRILMYEEVVGHPPRKDYPIGKRQPLLGVDDGAAPAALSDEELRPSPGGKRP